MDGRFISQALRNSKEKPSLDYKSDGKYIHGFNVERKCWYSSQKVLLCVMWASRLSAIKIFMFILLVLSSSTIFIKALVTVEL